MQSIKDIFSEAEDRSRNEANNEIEGFMECLENLKFDVEVMSDENKSIVYYYAGYISKSLLRSKTTSCSDCVEMISPDTKTFSLEIVEEEYTASISRGGLCKPADIVFITAIHAWVMWCYIRDNEDVKRSLWNTSNQRYTFVESFARKIEELESTRSIADAKCEKGHPFRPLIRRIATAMFNCIATNIVREMNSVIHVEKKRKAKKVESTNERKVIKLTSGTSTAKIVEASSKDCGECKFCKDKKKFGGPGTLKKKCVKK